MRFYSLLLILFILLTQHNVCIATINPAHIQQGDILINKNHHQWYTVHILALEKNEQQHNIAHSIIYQAQKQKPTIGTWTRNPIASQHAQIDIDDFKEWQKLTHKKPTIRDLKGYIHYLKHAHFDRYVHFTKQNKEKIIITSMAFDQKANNEKRQGHVNNAINLYKKAIELYPKNTTAMEHLASLYMETDLYEDALVLFESSLYIHPNNSTGQLLLGQCLMHLKRFYQAKRVFQEGLAQYPEQEALFAHYHQCAWKEQNNQYTPRIAGL
ncbi:tetratricopeptide repeat protein [uncultured Shewanella sp.]|uniref:tetratricopeptide repeat protein n=1 Tax=uncultured Shewanella sp. TaxID=173975 RepID=UPI002611DCD0|nr:tetratricopeptide repeat protein [uncultured Shewanella sp.]